MLLAAVLASGHNCHHAAVAAVAVAAVCCLRELVPACTHQHSNESVKNECLFCCIEHGDNQANGQGLVSICSAAIVLAPHAGFNENIVMLRLEVLQSGMGSHDTIPQLEGAAVGWHVIKLLSLVVTDLALSN